MAPGILTDIPILDQVLGAHAVQLGIDFVGYRNHAYRVANLCVVLAPGGRDELEKIAIASAFHDLGIWTDGTFDYLEPSARLARAHLAAGCHPEWILEVESMIADHHKLTPSRADTAWLVEPFRKADWIDVSRGALTFGLPARIVRPILAVWPSAGFHRRLIQLSIRRLRTHPLNPLPMMRL
ncbi:MAG: hypothetical protein ABUS56_08315 [Acidobacteriota bacterium]